MSSYDRFRLASLSSAVDCSLSISLKCDQLSLSWGTSAPAFTDVPEAMKSRLRPCDSAKEMRAPRPFTTIGVVHDALGRAMCKHDVGTPFDHEVMTTLRVILEAPSDAPFARVK
jgi:hypothetical protein